MSPKPIHSLEGATLILEPFAQRFVSQDYLDWMNDPDVTRFISKAQGKTSLEDLSRFAREMIDSPVDFFFAITLKEEGRHVGNVRLGPVDFAARSSRFGVMIGDKKIHGRGVGSETMGLITAFCFDDLNLDRLSFPVVRDHPPAMRLYEKTGFINEGPMDEIFTDREGRPWELVAWSMTNPKRGQSQ